jgi:hypothetical protein
MKAQYVVESVQPEHRTVTVLFFNPYHTGEHLVEVEYVTAEGVQTRIDDNDPNPHHRKTVNIPFKDGVPDQEGLIELLNAHAQSTRDRMEFEKMKTEINPDPNLMLALVGTISAPSEG